MREGCDACRALGSEQLNVRRLSPVTVAAQTQPQLVSHERRIGVESSGLAVSVEEMAWGWQGEGRMQGYASVIGICFQLLA